MDLPNFYSTAATLAPLLAAGQALYLRSMAEEPAHPLFRWLWWAFVVLPPLFVVLVSMTVLNGMLVWEAAPRLVMLGIAAQLLGGIVGPVSGIVRRRPKA